MTRIAIIGTGYVGLTTGACFAHLGHEVICADIDEAKVEKLNRGEIPIVEHRLEELVADGLRNGNLRFVLGAANAVADCEIAFLCVPTPQGDDGSADLSYVEAAAAEIAPVLPYEAIVVNKSTVPVGSTKVVDRVMKRPDVRVVSNPEFLREGSAVDDFLNPDRVVVGADDRAAAIAVGALYDIAAICEGVGADVNDVVVGMGYDKRIGTEFLRPGPGWGGSCFPKDSRALLKIANEAGYRFDLLAGVITVNEEQLDRVADKIRQAAGGSLEGKTVAVWGLTFKARTDDLRDSPSIAIVNRLLAQGATVQAYDPTVHGHRPGVPAGITIAADPYEAVNEADVLAVLTEWDDFRWLDPRRVNTHMRARQVVDGRNLLDRNDWQRAGFIHQGIGR